LIELPGIVPIWIMLTTLVPVPIVPMASCIGYSAFQARRPADMPVANTVWVNAPAVPFGFTMAGGSDAEWMQTNNRTDVGSTVRVFTRQQFRKAAIWRVRESHRYL